MNAAELDHRFQYHPPQSTDTADAHGEVRELHATLAHRMNELLPEGREKSTVMTNLEQSMMWANAAIARNGGRAAPHESL